MGLVDFEAGDFLGETNDEVAATLKGLTHFLHASLRTRVGCFGCFLGNGARTARVLTLELVAAFHNPLRTGNETDTPACHGIGLAHAVNNHNAVAH